ncbi:MAG: SusC/RagA family TonB-linked outer membrane protein [Verrucomicrobia bacterium]|nr:SusC/RagA family TonB-linked outer membrane protein [Cytophagales bacterium]
MATIFLGFGALAQVTYTIQGKIVDRSTNQLLPGVNVSVMGATEGTVTDTDGNYKLQTNNPNLKLVFSYIGYKSITQTITFNNQTTIVLDLGLDQDASNLDEVVIIGSTLTTPRKQLGNAINTISSKDIQNTGTDNALGALQGKIPGAQITQNSGDPAGGFTVRLRGVKSIRGNSDPLYVIDGVIVSNTTTNVSQVSVSAGDATGSLGTNRLADINPQDIESMSVINGSAAAAIYGSRASNGVVVITTKRGKSGTPKVSFTTTAGISELRKKVFISRHPEQFGTAALRLHTIGAATANPATGVTVSPFFRDGTSTNLATNKVPVTRYDYQDNVFQAGALLDNTLSIAGGTDKSQYYVSVFYSKNTGIVRGTDFQRYGLRLRLDQRLNSWAKISAGVTYTNSLSNEKPNGNIFASPVNSINITNNIYDVTLRDANGNLRGVEPSRVNPLSIIETFDITQSVNRTINDFQVNINPFKNFQIDWIVGLDAYSQVGKTFIPPYPYAIESALPPGLYPQGYVATVKNLVYLLNTDINLKYDWDISPSFTLNAAAGFNYQSNNQDFSRASGETLIPTVLNVSGATTTIEARDALDRFSINGIFAQATVGYKDRRFITAAIRRDGSTKFSPSETNQIYPKISGSWVISQEEFWKSLSIDNAVNDFKLRASYGESGGLNAINSYDRFRQYFPQPYLGRAAILPSTQLNNPNVRPERSKEFEFGADMSFWRDKIGLTITRYNQQIEALIVARDLAPGATGGSSIVNNVATMENKGWEVGLNLNPIKNKDFNWEIGLVYSRNRNKILSTGVLSNISINSAAGAPAALLVGQPASIFFGTYYARNADGTLLLTPISPTNASALPQTEKGTQTDNSTVIPGRNAAGQPNGSALRKIIGDPNPDYTASLTNTVSYKNFTFRFLLDAVQGLEVFNADKRTRNNVGIGDLAEKELKGEIPRGTVFALVPIEEYRIDDGSFVKLREVALSYTLPSIFKNVGSIRISIIGRNLYSWDNYSGYDPETNAGNNSDLLRGVDFGNVPIPRSYQFSLTATF